MSSSWMDILTAPSFRFIIGKERKVFNVPKNIFSYLSDPLDEMANDEDDKGNEIKEAAILECEPKVFAAACQMAYVADIGDFDDGPCLFETSFQEFPTWRYKSRDDYDRVTEGEQPSDQGSKKRKASEALEKEQVFPGFDWKRLVRSEQLDTNSPNHYSEYQKVFAVRRSQDLRPCESPYHEPKEADEIVSQDCISPPFMCKVYVFACKFEIETLKYMALQKLRMEFKDGLPYPEELIESLDYAYSNTERKEDCNDELREVLVGYAFSQVKLLYPMPTFREVLMKHPELAVDIICALGPFLPDPKPPQ